MSLLSVVGVESNLLTTKVALVIFDSQGKVFGVTAVVIPKSYCLHFVLSTDNDNALLLKCNNKPQEVMVLTHFIVEM